MTAEVLWAPAEGRRSRLDEFMAEVTASYGVSFATYDQLWRWSIGRDRAPLAGKLALVWIYPCGSTGIDAATLTAGPTALHRVSEKVQCSSLPDKEGTTHGCQTA